MNSLRAHHNVIDLAEQRRAREQLVRVVFPGFISEPIPEARKVEDEQESGSEDGLHNGSAPAE